MQLLAWLFGCKRSDALFPKSVEDVQEILKQARDNATPIRVTGGSFPFTPLAEDILVNVKYIDRLLGLDVYQQR